MAEVTIKEAASRLGVTEVTIRRRIRSGDVHAHQQSRPQGFTWVVELPDEEEQPVAAVGHAQENGTSSKVEDALQEIIKSKDEMIEVLRHELEGRGREVQELHVLLQQTQAALPAPKENRPWWRRLW